jgi:hypothetical protein
MWICVCTTSGELVDLAPPVAHHRAVVGRTPALPRTAGRPTPRSVTIVIICCLVCVLSFLASAFIYNDY